MSSLRVALLSPREAVLSEVWPREHEGTERDTEGAGDTKVIFSSRKSVFRDVRIDYNLDLSFLVKR